MIIDAQDFLLENSTFIDNFANFEAGGFMIEIGKGITLKNLYFSNHRAPVAGCFQL